MTFGRSGSILLVTVVLLAGCGRISGETPEEVLADTAERLGDITSADLDARFEITPSGAAGDLPFGWHIEGPVEFARHGLPEADVVFTQFVGDEEGTARFLSDGEQAVAEIDEAAYVLPEEQAAVLRGGAGDLGVLDISGWVRDPELENGPKIDGTETDMVRAELDAAAAFEDLLSLLPDDAAVSAGDATVLTEATRAASIEVVSGRDDRLLRGLVIELEFSSETTEQLGGHPIAGASFVLDIALTDVNRDVEVELPDETVPLP